MKKMILGIVCFLASFGVVAFSVSSEIEPLMIWAVIMSLIWSVAGAGLIISGLHE